jgi:hypothetical protein
MWLDFFLLFDQAKSRPPAGNQNNSKEKTIATNLQKEKYIFTFGYKQ